MKKVLIPVGSALIAILIFAAGVYAASDIKLIINGKPVLSDIQIIEGSSYVPLRVVSESLGADVKWDGDSRTIIITGKGAAAPVSADVKSYNLNVNITSGPFNLDINKVTLDPAYKPNSYSSEINAIVLDVTVENTSTDTVSWYPDQGTIVTNTKEQVDAKLFYGDQVGGDFIGKVIKSGKIIFEVKSDLKDITSFTYTVRGPFNENFTRVGEDKTTEVILK